MRPVAVLGDHFFSSLEFLACEQHWQTSDGLTLILFISSNVPSIGGFILVISIAISVFAQQAIRPVPLRKDSPE